MSTNPVLRPASEIEAAALVREAQAHGRPLRLMGGGTRHAFGRPVHSAATLISTALTGITLYEPAEMVIAARAGTPLALIEDTLAAQGQMLPFEPMDHRRLYASTGTPSIGGVVAGNLSGPRRLWAGACRDHLIGVRFVNGAGEIIKSGGRVMKNVTGLDLVKLQAGAWGTLGFLTKVTFKVVPRPETTATLALDGLDDAKAVAAMALAVGSPFEITGAAHCPAGIAGSNAQTLLRIEGFAASVDYRAGELAKRLAAFGTLHRLGDEKGTLLWAAIRDGALLAEPREQAIWRLSIKPSEAARLVAALSGQMPLRALYDWGGGLVWLACAAGEDGGAARIRAAAAAAEGHATLMRGPEALRAAVPVFEPESPAIAALTRRIKASLDEGNLFNPGLMQAGN